MTKNGLDHCLAQTVGADSISALFRADMESAPTQDVAERMIKAKDSQLQLLILSRISCTVLLSIYRDSEKNKFYILLAFLSVFFVAT